MSALNGDLLFIFDKKPNSSDAKCGDNHTAKGEDEIHFLLLNSNAPAKSIITTPSTMARVDFKGILVNCKAKTPFTKIPSPMFRQVLNKSSKNLSFIEKMIAKKSKFEKLNLK